MDEQKADKLRSCPEFKKFAACFLWNTTPEKALTDMNGFFAHVMARSSENAFKYAKETYGLTDDDFREAFRNSPPGEFMYWSNWNKWNKILGFDPPLPPPMKYQDSFGLFGSPED